MKTVFIDNSLCINPIRDNVRGEDICQYIKSLAAAGVQYAEVDFRTLMKLEKLPEEMKYIFRPVSPMFMNLEEVYDFSYVLLSFSDIKYNYKPKTPVMLELPALENAVTGALRMARSGIEGEITAVRLTGSFDIPNIARAREFVDRVRHSVPLPFDVCPKNNARTALDSALKFAFSDADSVTLTLGQSKRFASLEELFVTYISVYNFLPQGLDLYELFAAAHYFRRIFANGSDADFSRIIELLDWDIRMLKNADTGENVPMRLSIKNRAQLGTKQLSAVEKMLAKEDLARDEIETLLNAARKCTAAVCEDEVAYGVRKGLLN